MPSIHQPARTSCVTGSMIEVQGMKGTKKKKILKETDLESEQPGSNGSDLKSVEVPAKTSLGANANPGQLVNQAAKLKKAKKKQRAPQDSDSLAVNRDDMVVEKTSKPNLGINSDQPDDQPDALKTKSRKSKRQLEESEAKVHPVEQSNGPLDIVRKPKKAKSSKGPKIGVSNITKADGEMVQAGPSQQIPAEAANKTPTVEAPPFKKPKKGKRQAKALTITDAENPSQPSLAEALEGHASALDETVIAEPPAKKGKKNKKRCDIGEEAKSNPAEDATKMSSEDKLQAQPETTLQIESGEAKEDTKQKKKKKKRKGSALTENLDEDEDQGKRKKRKLDPLQASEGKASEDNAQDQGQDDNPFRPEEKDAGFQTEHASNGAADEAIKDLPNEEENAAAETANTKKGTAAKAFQRVKAEEWLHQKAAKDNSYEATFGNAGWGAKAQEVLGQVRGKDFRHEKTKKKRGSYRGGLIDDSINSFKFDSDDD